METRAMSWKPKGTACCTARWALYSLAEAASILGSLMRDQQEYLLVSQLFYYFLFVCLVSCKKKKLSSTHSEFPHWLSFFLLCVCHNCCFSSAVELCVTTQQPGEEERKRSDQITYGWISSNSLNNKLVRFYLSLHQQWCHLEHLQPLCGMFGDIKTVCQ